MAPAFWASVSGFLVGVALASQLHSSLPVAAFLGLLALALFVLSPRHLAASFFSVFVIFGLWRADMPVPRDPALDALLGTEVTLSGVVVAEPDERERSTRLTVELESGARVLVIVSNYTGVAYGDRIDARGELGLPQRFEAGEGRTFDYPSYLALSGIAYMLSFAEIERTGAGEGSRLVAAAVALKRRYVDGLEQVLGEPHAGLAAGITAGDKRGLGKELSETFRVVGLTHIVVLSGYNIMIVIALFERLLATCRARTRFVIGVSVAVFFVLMTGFASASVRAASMASIALFARATGRTYDALRALGIVATGMVAVNPRTLLFDPGFQLSVIATWGLVSISPLLESRLERITERFGLRSIVASTIGTQIAVLPILLFQSGTLSFVSLPANILVLPVVPLAMLASFISGVAGAIAGGLAVIVGAPAYVLLSYVIEAAQALSVIPYAAVPVPPFPFALVVLVYVFLVIVVHVRNDPRQSAS
jgi:competence protein ComEC